MNDQRTVYVLRGFQMPVEVPQERITLVADVGLLVQPNGAGLPLRVKDVRVRFRSTAMILQAQFIAPESATLRNEHRRAMDAAD